MDTNRERFPFAFRGAVLRETLRPYTPPWLFSAFVTFARLA